MSKKPRIYYGWTILAVGFVTVILGYFMRNTFSVFFPAVVQQFGWARGDTALMFSVTLFVYGLMAPLVGSLFDRYEPRLAFPLGACIAGVGIALCSLATALWHFYLLYGVVTAIGLSFLGVSPVTTILSNWFVRRRGLAFSLLSSGFGISLALVSPAQMLISKFHWQTAYVIIGVFCILVIAPSTALLIRRKPQDMGLQGDSAPEPSLGAGTSETAPADALQSNLGIR